MQSHHKTRGTLDKMCVCASGYTRDNIPRDLRARMGWRTCEWGERITPENAIIYICTAVRSRVQTYINTTRCSGTRLDRQIHAPSEYCYKTQDARKTRTAVINGRAAGRVDLDVTCAAPHACVQSVVE